MSKNTSVALGGHFEQFIGEQVSAGRFGNASEVIRAGLRLLEEQELRLQELRAAIRDGLESGPAAPFDMKQFIHQRATGKNGG